MDNERKREEEEREEEEVGKKRKKRRKRGKKRRRDSNRGNQKYTPVIHLLLSSINFHSLHNFPIVHSKWI